VTELSGNPKQHIQNLRDKGLMRDDDGAAEGGEMSLQNALDMVSATCRSSI
jgi:hypothetical protein